MGVNLSAYQRWKINRLSRKAVEAESAWEDHGRFGDLNRSQRADAALERYTKSLGLDPNKPIGQQVDL